MVHVEVVHQTFFGHQHSFFCCTANANAQHARWAPAGTHGGHGFQNPVDDAVAGVQHDHLGFVLTATAFGGHGNVQLIAWHNLREDDSGGVVLRILAGELWVRDHRGTQHVFGVVVTAANTFVDGVFQTACEVLKLHVHADLQEHIDDAGVLANGAVANGAHFAVGQNLRDGVFGRRALLAVIRTGQMRNEIGRVVVADVLQCGCNRFNQVFLFDQSGHVSLSRGQLG